MAPRPFFVPSTASEIDDALRFAGLRPGEMLLDLGCGDGRVLIQAGRMGAEVVGLELDRALVRRACDALTEAGLNGSVHEGDIMSVAPASFAPDVVFAFLSAASLQALVPMLVGLAQGTRVLTLGSAVPGWTPTATLGAVSLYTMPAQPSPVAPVGWALPGMAAILRANQPTLTSFQASHGPGPVAIEVCGDLCGIVSVETGYDVLERQGAIGIDLFWRARPVGTRAEGMLRSSQLGALPVAVFYSDEGPFGATPIEFPPAPPCGT